MKRLLLLLTLCFTCLFAQAQERIFWKKISAGGEFSVGLMTDSTLLTWGANEYGQLGNNITSDAAVTTPTIISEFSDWYDIDAGAYHTLGLKDSGSLYGWGNNVYENINGLYTQIVKKPTKITEKTGWVKIFAGLHNSFAIDSSGHLYGWGRNTYGQLGLSSVVKRVAQPTLIDSTREWVNVATGHEFTLFLDIEGQIYGAGHNDKFQLTDHFGSMVDSLVLLDSTNNYIDIGANFATGHGIRDDGNLVSWGYNKYRESGIDMEELYIETITPTSEENSYTELYCGSVYCLMKSEDNQIYGIGTNGLGAMGVMNPEVFVTAAVVNENYWDAISVSIGLDDGLEIFGGHTLWLNETNRNEYCASGANYIGQLGNGETNEIEDGLTCSIGVISGVDDAAIRNINVFPNPFTNEIFIEMPDVNIEFVRLISINGVEVFRQNVSTFSHTTIQAQKLSSGLYILQFIDKGGSMTSIKLIKQ